MNTTESDPEARRFPGDSGNVIVVTGTSSTRGGHTPFIAPYFAAKAALDSLATDYADELIRFGIDTGIVVPGAFTSGTRHFDHSGHPADTQRAAEYDAKVRHLHATPAGTSLAAGSRHDPFRQSRCLTDHGDSGR